MNELTKQIASDLMINKFQEESDEEYGNRILYCALASWIKVQTLGSSYIDENNINKNYQYTSKRYITEKMRYIAKGLVSSIPHIESWVNSSHEEVCNEIIEYIIKNLIYSYQISETCKSGYVMTTPKREVYFKNNKLILGGAEWNNLKKTYSVGLGVWQLNDKKYNINYKEIFNIPQCTVEDYYSDMEINSKWQQMKLDGNYEYFSGETGLWHNKGWKVFNKKNIPTGISLLRKMDKTDNYSLLLYKDGKMFTAKLDEWYIKENEVNRIMFALEYYRNKPAEFKAKKRGDFIELHCHSMLPDAENRIMLMASWPKRKYNDKYFRQIPKDLWEDIQYVLSGLWIKVVFE